MSDLEGFDYIRFTGSAHGISDWVDEDALARRVPAGFIRQRPPLPAPPEDRLPVGSPENSFSTVPAVVSYEVGSL